KEVFLWKTVLRRTKPARCQRAAAYLNERLVSRSGAVEQRPQLTCLKAKTSLRRRNSRKVPLDRSAFSDSPSEYHSDKGRRATDKRESPRKQERNYRHDCCRPRPPGSGRVALVFLVAITTLSLDSTRPLYRPFPGLFGDLKSGINLRKEINDDYSHDPC